MQVEAVTPAHVDPLEFVISLQASLSIFAFNLRIGSTLQLQRRYIFKM